VRSSAAAFMMFWIANAAQAQDRSFQFAFFGDMPYTKVHEQQYLRVLAELNEAELAFVVHIGDFQGDPRLHNENPSSASMPCVDEYYAWILGTFQSVRHPFILTPGDNDWTDCHSLKARKADPIELLGKVRTMFFPEGRSLGQRTIPVSNQSADPRYAKFRENLRWSMAGVSFATLHIVGSNDNLGRTPENDAEHFERKSANLDWMKQAFAKAKADGSRGLVLMTQVDPNFENYWPPEAKARFLRMIPGARPPDEPRPSVYDDYMKALTEEVENYDKPIAFLHGDTHWFRVDKPLYSAKTKRPFENFTRVETFGNPDAHWVQVHVDPADPQLFRFNAQIASENVVNRRTK
jgi:hypothetical protein